MIESMNVAGTEYNLANKAFEIYLSGCSGHPCPGCHNKELWDDSVGTPLTDGDLLSWTGMLCNNVMVDRVWILGGEPLEHNLYELIRLIRSLRNTGKEIWLWTRFEENQVPKIIKDSVDYIKTGMYDSRLPSYKEPLFGITLASNNQKIIKTRS